LHINKRYYPPPDMTLTAHAATRLAVFLLITSLVISCPWVQASGSADNAATLAASAHAGSTPSHSATDEITRLRLLPESLVPTRSESSLAENIELLAALDLLRQRSDQDDFSALVGYVDRFPESPWRLAVQLNLGLLEYRRGQFSRSLKTFKSAWSAGRGIAEGPGKLLADRAAGEYAKLLARLGRYDELDLFFADIPDRTFVGQASELIAAAREGRALMEDRPGVAFRCGPLALASIAISQGDKEKAAALVQQSESSRLGISLGDLAQISAQAGMDYIVAQRQPGAALVVPSVIHWKVGHYAALLPSPDGKGYISRDPTFGQDLSVSQRVVDEEASGYFLIPSGPLPAGWSTVSQKDASSVYGRGATSGNDQTATRPTDHKCGGDQGGICRGMAAYAFHTMLVSLNIVDTPVGYTPPVGPAVNFTATYNQREAFQPTTFYFSNLGPKWSFSWLSYVEDDPESSASALVAVAGGGTLEFSGFDPQTNRFAVQRNSQAVLHRVSKNPIVYDLLYPDGSVDRFAVSDGTELGARRIFLSSRTDPRGNAVSLSYDSNLRIETITDALGQQTRLFYEASSEFLISKVVDPFGREARFSYDEIGRLITITDILGLQSGFTYEDASDFVETLTTPYGETQFATSSSGRTRRLTATDPAGDMEVLEFNEGGVIPDIDPPDTLPADMFLRNSVLDARNSFYWSKKAWREAPEDYKAAHLYHWLHTANYAEATTPLESEKPAKEARIWYNYPGQPENEEGATVVGTIDKPSKIGRRIEGGATQLWQYNYNDLGKVLSATDPVGRVTSFTYATNNIDLLRIEQQGSGGGVLAEFTYDDRHLVLTAKDAAGKTTTFAYNSLGQLVSTTDPLGQTTTFNYFDADASGKQRKHRVASVNGPLPGDSDIVSFDYDARGNLALLTGPDGYHVAMQYDVFDRLERRTFPDGTYEILGYDRLDLVSLTDRLGRQSTLTYNALRQLTSVVDPANRTVKFAWCKCGSLKQIIDALGRTTSWRYDVQGRPLQKIYADGSSQRYRYTPLSGRLSAIIDEKGQVQDLAYNLDETIASWTFLNAAVATPAVSFSYDAAFPRLVSMTDGTGTTAYAYNAIVVGTLGAGRLASVDGPLAGDTDKITYTYDELGRSKGYAVNGVGETVDFDALGRVIKAVNPLGTFNYTYVGPTGRPQKVDYPNGMSANFSYNDLAGDFRLNDLHYQLADNSTVARFSYAYNAVGNITQWTQRLPAGNIARRWDTSYDNVDQLTAIVSRNPDTGAALPTGNYAYTHDKAGNRLTETIDGVTAAASYNALNQLVSIAGGNSAALPNLTYEWDANDRLVAINYPGSNNRSEFTYDGLGRRMSVTEKTGNTVNAQNKFVWAGLAMLEQRDAAGTAVQKRYFGSGMQTLEGDQFVARLFARDHLGSVRSVLAGTTTAATVDYGPWGQRTVAGSDPTSLAFTGHWLHAPSALAVAPYRSYAPWQGRWLSRDPIGESDGVNLYAYVANNPVSLFDPMGLESMKSSASLQDQRKPFGDGAAFIRYHHSTVYDGIIHKSIVLRHPFSPTGFFEYDFSKSGWTKRVWDWRVEPRELILMPLRDLTPDKELQLTKRLHDLSGTNETYGLFLGIECGTALDRELAEVGYSSRRTRGFRLRYINPVQYHLYRTEQISWVHDYITGPIQ